MANPNTVKLKAYQNVIEEGVANAAITPGELIEWMSTGKVRKHATADGNAIPMFALENELEGKGLADNYAADDRVQCWIAGRGDQVYTLLKDGQNVAIGDYLVSAGDGSLKKLVVTSAGVVEQPLQVVAQALEALNLSGSASVANARLKVRVV